MSALVWLLVKGAAVGVAAGANPASNTIIKGTIMKSASKHRDDKVFELDLSRVADLESPIVFNPENIRASDIMNTLYLAPQMAAGAAVLTHGRRVLPIITEMAGKTKATQFLDDVLVNSPRAQGLAARFGVRGTFLGVTRALAPLNPYMWADLGVLGVNTLLHATGLRDDEPEGLTDVLIDSGKQFVGDVDNPDADEQMAGMASAVTDWVNPTMWFLDDDSARAEATRQDTADAFRFIGLTQENFGNEGSQRDKLVETGRDIAEHGFVGSAWETATGDLEEDGVAQVLSGTTTEDRALARSRAASAVSATISGDISAAPAAVLLTADAAAREVINPFASTVDFVGTLGENTLAATTDFLTGGSAVSERLEDSYDNMSKWELMDQRQRWDDELQTKIEADQRSTRLSRHREDLVSQLQRMIDAGEVSVDPSRDLNSFRTQTLESLTGYEE